MKRKILKSVLSAPILCASLMSVSPASEDISRPNVIWINTNSGATDLMPVEYADTEGNVTIMDNVNVVETYNPSFTPVGECDFTGDGKTDILLHNAYSAMPGSIKGMNTTTDEDENLILWEMDGVVKANEIPIGTISPEFIIAGAGDFDGDGDCDIASFNTITAGTTIWEMDGLEYVNSHVVPGGGNLNLVPQAVGDMNNDNIPDIILRNDNSGQARIWVMNSDYTRSANIGPIASNTNLRLKGAIDIDGDGNTDILNYNINSGNLNSWLMDGNFGRLANITIAQSDNIEEESVSGALFSITPMNEEQTKDAMAINAIAYPMLVPVLSYMDDLSVSANKNAKQDTNIKPFFIHEDGTEWYMCTEGDLNQGTYSRNVNTDGDTRTTVYSFGGDVNDGKCYDIANMNNIQNKLTTDCLLTLIIPIENEPLMAAIVEEPVYKVEYEGEVTCTRTENMGIFHSVQVNLDGYTVTATGNGSQYEENRWQYDILGSFTVNNSYRYTANNGAEEDNQTIALNGFIRGQYWNGTIEENNLTNDEAWAFEDFNLVHDNMNRDVYNNNVIADGKAAYVGAVRRGDTENPDLNLSLEFDKLTYLMDGAENQDANVKVAGSVKASCVDRIITYTTGDDGLQDLTDVRDDNDARMPLSGKMGIGLEGYVPSSAKFSGLGGNSSVDLKSQISSQNYDSWRSITDGSNCQIMQDILDRLLGD